jgi:hypothetical protein
VEGRKMMQEFNAAGHPVVVDGRMTEQQAIDEFLNCFENTTSPTVSQLQFVEAYTNLSATIQSDEQFCELVQGVWSLNDPLPEPTAAS